MEECLKELSSKDPRSQEKNNTRRSIKDLFKDRNCLTFVRPVMEEHKLSRIEEMNFSDLRPEFRQSISDFLHVVQTNMKPKMINGKGISGKMMVELTSQYIDAFNKGGCPEILPSLERVIAQEVNSITQEKLKVYSEFLIGKLKEYSAIRDSKEVMPVFNTIVGKLESDLWQNAFKKQNYELFWTPRDRVTKELREILNRFLDGVVEKRRTLVDKVKTKFAQSLLPPKKTPIDTFFSVQRMKEYHKGMIGWLEKSLDKGSLF